MLDQIGVVGVSIVPSGKGLGSRITGGWPAGLCDKDRDVGEIEATEGESGRIKHGIKEVGVVEEGVRVNLLLGGGEGFEEGRVEGDDSAGAHEGVVWVEVEHEGRVGGGEEVEEGYEEMRC